VITATVLRGYADRMRDFEVDTVDDAGHWIVEQQPGLVLDRLQAFLAGPSPSRRQSARASAEESAHEHPARLTTRLRSQLLSGLAHDLRPQVVVQGFHPVRLTFDCVRRETRRRSVAAGGSS
jgi:hypothetical protein